MSSSRIVFLTEALPNAVCGTYDAIEAKFGIPIIYTARSRILATERAASWLSKHFTYWRDLQNPSWCPLEAGHHEGFCK